MLVLDTRFKQYRARLRVDRVIYKNKLALRDGRPTTNGADFNFQLRGIPGASHVVQVALRHAERHQNRFGTIDDYKRSATRSRIDQVTRPHAKVAGAARNRRADLRVRELQLGLLQLGTARGNRGF